MLGLCEEREVVRVRMRASVVSIVVQALSVAKKELFRSLRLRNWQFATITAYSRGPTGDREWTGAVERVVPVEVLGRVVTVDQLRGAEMIPRDGSATGLSRHLDQTRESRKVRLPEMARGIARWRARLRRIRTVNGVEEPLLK